MVSFTEAFLLSAREGGGQRFWTPCMRFFGQIITVLFSKKCPPTPIYYYHLFNRGAKMVKMEKGGPTLGYITPTIPEQIINSITMLFNNMFVPFHSHLGNILQVFDTTCWVVKKATNVENIICLVPSCKRAEKNDQSCVWAVHCHPRRVIHYPY